MPNVIIRNLNKYDYSELFKGQMIQIPAGGFIEMEYFEAHQFLGKMNNIVKDKDGNIDPRSYKYLAVDEESKKQALDELNNAGSSEERKEVYICHACAKDFRTKNGLLKHIKDKHSHLIVDKDARDELLDDEDL